MSRPVTSRDTVESWIRTVPELQFDGIELFCKCCQKTLSWTHKSNVLRHISSEVHKSRVSGSGKYESSYESIRERQKKFNLNLLHMMVVCNIPWNTLENPLFKQFIQECVGSEYNKNVEVPDESTLRKKYLKRSCDSIISNVASELEGKYIWMCTDETTDASGRKIANVIVGALEENVSMKGHLIASKELVHTNTQSVVDLVRTSLHILWEDKYEENKDKLLLFMTDADSYMTSAGRLLQMTYTNLLHVTCLAHGLHRVAETIGECFPNIDKLITSVKNVFLKAPERQQLFHELLPKTPLPPQPTPKKWGTWLNAASYYYRNFDNIKKIIRQLDAKEAVAVANAQEAIVDPNVQKDLEFIHSSFSRIPLAIEQLERPPKTGEFTIIDAVNVVFDLRHYMYKLSGDIAEHVNKKLESVLQNNPGFVTVHRIVDLLQGKEVDCLGPQINMASLRMFPYFKYAPVTSVEIDRSFSTYKWIFADRRRILTAEHMEQLLIIYFTCKE